MGKLTRIATCLAAVVAAAVAAESSLAVDVNACRYSSQPPVVAAVKTLDPAGTVKVQTACRVSITPRGGTAAVVLTGNAFPASQLLERLRIARGIGQNEDDFTRGIVTPVPGLKDAYLVREVWKDGTGTQLQSVLVKRGPKLLLLTNLGLGTRSTETSHFLKPAQLYAIARLLR